MSYQLSKEELRKRKSRREQFNDIPRNDIYIILDSLKCAHNVGTILRLADSLLVKKLDLVPEEQKNGCHGSIMKMH